MKRSNDAVRLFVRDGLRRLRERPALVAGHRDVLDVRLVSILRAVFQVAFVRGTEARDTRSTIDLRGAANIAQRRTGCRKGVPPHPRPLADAKRTAKSHGASVTDFVMATASGALRRLLIERGEVLKRDLIAFVPINVRGEGDTASWETRSRECWLRCTPTSSTPWNG
jgi:hypothetical protein